MSVKIMVPAVVWKEDDFFVAKTVGLELASQGSTKKEALNNLQEALDLFLEDEKVKVTPQNFPKQVELEAVYA